MTANSHLFFKASLALLVSAELLGGHHGNAAEVTIFEDNSNVETVVGVTGFATEGDDMAGMLVTVFSNESPAGESAAWAATGAGAGAAAGTGWSLGESGDTFSDSGVPGSWIFDTTGPNLVVDRILLQGFVSNDQVNEGGTVFDQTEPFFGTEGTFRGRDYLADGMLGEWNLDVTYIDPVQVNGDPLERDIYRALEIDFVDTAAGGGQFLTNDRLTFRQDTDTVGPFVPGACEGPECVPEPSILALVALSLIGLPLFRTSARQS